MEPPSLTQWTAGWLQHSTAVLQGFSKQQFLEAAEESSDGEGDQSTEHSTVDDLEFASLGTFLVSLGGGQDSLEHLHDLVAQLWSKGLLCLLPTSIS